VASHRPDEPQSVEGSSGAERRDGRAPAELSVPVFTLTPTGDDRFLVVINPESETAWRRSGMDQSPVYRSRGHSAVFTVEAEFAAAPHAALDVFVEHSDGEEKEWTVAGRFPSITMSGTTSVDVTGVKKFYRGSAEPVPGAVGDVCRLEVQEPRWRTGFDESDHDLKTRGKTP
jgi:hypothetical protein